MNRRLYFMLPDVKSAQVTMNELLLARVNADRIHFLAKPGVSLGDLPKATVSEQTDMLEGWEIGTALGAALGFLAGLLAVWIPPWPFTTPVPLIAIPICAFIGALGGGLWTTLVASAIPDARLKPFERQLDQGKVLMMVQVPFHRTHTIRELVARTHPEVAYGGTWPAEHVVFP